MRLWPFRRGPEHCERCGDAFVEDTYHDGYSRRDGSERRRRWRRCPRSDGWEGIGSLRRVGQRGRCMPPPHFACANEKRAYYREHRPWRGACTHVRVSENGGMCWGEYGGLITYDGPGIPV